MKVKWISIVLSASTFAAAAQAGSEVTPVVLGEGVGLFKVGPLLYSDDFADLKNWIVQIEQRAGSPAGIVEARNHMLDCMVPGNGCTVWYKQKLKTRVAITYDVICPTPETPVQGLQARDINNFWMAADPVDPDKGLFDAARYTGAFGSYGKMLGYYASTGGGGAKANLTTRMRRYPRAIGGKPVEHIALNDKDGQADFLITPDKLMTVQLVAYDDVIQYIVDGRLVYQIARGDRIQVEGCSAEGRPVMRETIYDLDRFPVYREGYFGFRMAGTHHIYSNFRVYALEPDAGAKPGFREISSIEELRAASAASNQNIRMRPGIYRVTDALADNQTVFNFTGSNNFFDLRGVTIQIDTQVMARMTSKAAHELCVYRIKGDRLRFEGATFEDVGDAPPQRSLTEFGVMGNDVTFKGCRFIIRGSAPYGYGDLYGKGRGAAVWLQKHAGMGVNGDRCRVEDCYFRIQAYGHGLHMHGAQDTFIRNVTMLGDLRPTDAIYEEPAGLAAEFDYKRTFPPWCAGQPIPRGEMLSLTEDGIRAYTDGINKEGEKRRTGHIMVENCTVERMRGGIALSTATGATVTDCTVLEAGGHAFGLPSDAKVRGCRGDAAFAPLLSIPYSNLRNADIEIELLASENEMGDHPLAGIVGSGHRIKLACNEKGRVGALRPIILGTTGDRYTEENTDRSELRAKNRAEFIMLINETPHPVYCTEYASHNEVITRGSVEDKGRDNKMCGTNGDGFK